MYSITLSSFSLFLLPVFHGDSAIRVTSGTMWALLSELDLRHSGIPGVSLSKLSQRGLKPNRAYCMYYIVPTCRAVLHQLGSSGRRRVGIAVTIF